MIATYHNHTTWSDGRSSIAEMVARARELGVQELGISDHCCVHPTGVSPKWSMDPRKLPQYVEELKSFADQSLPAVRLGLEVCWFPGHGDAIRSVLAAHPFDYLIGSVHEVNGFTIDGNAEPWQKMTPSDRAAIFRQYWKNVRSLAESRLFDIVAHIDLPKKFGYDPTTGYEELIEEALDAVEKSKMVVELNTSGWHKPCRNGYPTIEIVKMCAARRIPMLLSADAHEPDHLLRDFPRGAQRLYNGGITEVARFKGRQMSLHHVEECVARF